MNDKKTTILFLGTPEFAVPVLEKLQKHFQIIGVVTQPDRPVGRKLVLTPPPVKRKALELGLKVYQAKKASQITDLVTEDVDFIVTAAYGEYLPQKVLKMSKRDALNVHPSFLPNYRGATPMQTALLNGDHTTGVSIIRMAKEMDSGEIFAQEKVAILSDTRYPDLEKECSELGAGLMTQVINQYDEITPTPQDHQKATYCKKITKEDGLIRWYEDTAYDIYNKLRAFTPWPGVYAFYKQQKLNLLEFTVSDDPNAPEQELGKVYEKNDGVYIRCSTGSIKLEKIQLAGKNPVDIKSFVNGHPDFIEAKLS